MATRQVLQGLRIIDAGTVLAAPGAAGLLADFGAEVIKIEQPGRGDPLRRFPPHVDGQSLTSKVTNRGKHSATLDLGSDRGREIFMELVQISDGVILNFRPPTLSKWGLDYPNLRAAKSDIVALHLTGFGRTGPFSDRPGFARVAEAYVGLTYMSGYPDRPPVPAGYAVADAIGGVFGAFSMMLGLLHHQRTGEGQLIDLALYESLMRVLDGLYIGYDVTGKIAERSGTTHQSIAPHDIYPLADDVWVSLPVSTQNMFERLCAGLGVAELIDDPRFVDNATRVRHKDELDAILRPLIGAQPSDTFLPMAESFGIAASRVNTVADFAANEHVQERESLLSMWDENLARQVRMQAVVPRLSHTPGKIPWVGHEPGQDNSYVFGSLLGYSDQDCASLADAGVI